MTSYGENDCEKCTVEVKIEKTPNSESQGGCARCIRRSQSYESFTCSECIRTSTPEHKFPNFKRSGDAYFPKQN